MFFDKIMNAELEKLLQQLAELSQNMQEFTVNQERDFNDLYI